MFLNTALSFSTVWSKVWPFLVAILFFGIVIMFHELGHFLFAKLFKVKVNEFSIGMGPAIFKKKKGDTNYAGATVNLIMGVIIVAIMLCQSDLIGTTQIRSFYDNATSAASGLEAGDKIVKINGKRVYSQYDITFLMMRDDDGVMDFVVKRDGKKVELKDVKFQTSPIEGQENLISIHYDFVIVGVKPTFLSVTKNAFLESISIGRMAWISLFDLITGRYGLNEVSGPIGIINYVADAASASSTSMDWTPLLTIMALIAINVGLFNLLPIPALDGGRLFFMFIELIIRRPIPQKFEKWVHAVGMILLLAFMAVISFKDIVSLIRG